MNKNEIKELTLQELYEYTNRFVDEYQNNKSLSETRKNFLVTDFMEASIKFRHKVVNIIIAKEKLTGLITHEEAFEISQGEAIIDTFKETDRRSHALVLWGAYATNRIKNHVDTITTEKEKFNRKAISGDKVNEFGTEGFDMASEKDFTEGYCLADALSQYILDFEAEVPFGGVVRFLGIAQQKERQAEILNYLGASEYGAKERKQVQRIKEKFAKFLLDKDIFM